MGAIWLKRAFRLSALLFFHLPMLAPAALLSDAPLPDLLVRCRRFEPAAQWALYNRFAGPMLTVVTRYAPTLADAEDILQDAFIKVFQKLHEQREDGAFAGWVRRIVVSTAIDAWHHRRVRRTGFDLDEAHQLPAPDASAIERLTLEEVKALIDRLPDGCRLVLLLYTVEGYSHAEIAALLGIGESGSKAQLTRARQRLTALARADSRERSPAPPTPAPSAPPNTVRRPDLHPASEAPFNPLTVLLFQ